MACHILHVAGACQSVHVNHSSHGDLGFLGGATVSRRGEPTIKSYGDFIRSQPPACILVYRVCGLAITAGIAVKFGTAHGRSRPAVGSVKCIGSYGRKGVPPAPCIFGTSQQKMITPTELLRPIYNFYSLTICSYDQYLLNNSSHRLQC